MSVFPQVFFCDVKGGISSQSLKWESFHWVGKKANALSWISLKKVAFALVV